jgi:hypothetical protein
MRPLPPKRVGSLSECQVPQAFRARSAGDDVGLTSTLVGGAGRDAALVVRHIAQQRNAVTTGCTQLNLDAEAAR